MSYTNNELIFVDPSAQWGFHVTKEATLTETFMKYENAFQLSSLQIYVANPKGYDVPHITAQDLFQSSTVLSRSEKFGCIHGCLMYNIAGGAKEYDSYIHSKTVEKLKAELDIAAGFSLGNSKDSGVVVHAGSCNDTKRGLDISIQTLNKVLSETSECTEKYSQIFGKPVNEYISSRKVFIENSAGEGTKLGRDLDQLAYVLNGVDEKYKKQVGVCIDTMHIFGAGMYNFGDVSDVVRFFNDFDAKIGLEKLKVIHLNDCDPSVNFGDRKDRHACLCMGSIWGDFCGVNTNEKQEEMHANKIASLKYLIDRTTKLGIPLIGETPDSMWDFHVIDQLCGVIKNPCNC